MFGRFNKLGKTLFITIFALVVAVSLPACAARRDSGASAGSAGSADVSNEAQDIQYILYLGTNDKDTNEPVFSREESKQILKDILIKKFGGYTISDAEGGWVGEDGKEYQEYTLIIYLSDTDIEQVHSVCDELIKVYDQSSILIQSNHTTTEFYSGE